MVASAQAKTLEPKREGAWLTVLSAFGAERDEPVGLAPAFSRLQRESRVGMLNSTRPRLRLTRASRSRCWSRVIRRNLESERVHQREGGGGVNVDVEPPPTAKPTKGAARSPDNLLVPLSACVNP